MAKDEKRDLIKKALDKFTKDFKLTDDKVFKVGFLSDNPELGVLEKMPTGVVPFDTITDGGFVKGQINIIYGGESAGKTTTMLRTIAHNQKLDPNFYAAYLNNEKTFDRSYAESLGVDESRVIIMECETAEQSSDFCIAMLESGVDALFIDTLQALASSSEINDKGDKTKSVEANTMALMIVPLSRN